jgi:CheY-like chemotaxis protein
MDYGLDNVRVLVVEDESLLALELEAMLQASGCTVVALTSTSTAPVPCPWPTCWPTAASRSCS